MASRMTENGGGPRVAVQRDRLADREDASLAVDLASERRVSRLERSVFRAPPHPVSACLPFFSFPTR